MVKKIITGICVIFFFVWCYKIYDTNKIKCSAKDYSMQEVVEYGNFTVCGSESNIFTQDEFEKRFEINPQSVCDYMPSDSKIIGIKLTAENTSDADVSLDEVIGNTELGFEMITWATAIEPYLGLYINVYDSYYIEPGATQDIWYFAIMNKISMRDKTWNNLFEHDIYYVLSLEPDKIRIKLELMEK